MTRGQALAKGADPLTPEQRRLNMSRIRARDTRPELVVRRGLHARGLRYRLHVRALPGRPDLVFLGRRAVIFVNGCFWHGHDCDLFRLPLARRDFWAEKISANRARDRRSVEDLLGRGWRVMTVWECALRGSGRMAPDVLIDSVAEWLAGAGTEGELRGAVELS